MGIISKIFSGGANSIIKSASDLIDKNFTSDEERLQAKAAYEAELHRHIEAMESEVAHQYELEIKDRDGARNREIESLKAGGKNYTQEVLAYIGTFAFFGLVFYVVAKGLGNMTTETSFIIGNLTGISAAIAKDIYGYYFGSSRSSADKQNQINKMMSGSK